jgi:hypothetical protein
VSNTNPAFADLLQTLGEIDRDMTDLARDVLDLKDNSDGSADLLGLQSKVSSAQLAITQIRVEIDKLMNPEEGARPGAPKTRPPSRNEAVEDPTSTATLALIRCGYSRDMHAPVNEIRYSHPDGHQIHIKMLPEADGYHWRHFPPGLRGQVSKGYAVAELQQHLDRIHRRDVTEQKDRRFSVVQVGDDPLERFLIREAGEQYPAIVQHNPVDGSWHCYTCAPGLRDGPEYDIHLEAAKRWVQKGKPTAEPSGTDGAEPSNQGFDVPTGLPDTY